MAPDLPHNNNKDSHPWSLMSHVIDFSSPVILGGRLPGSSRSISINTTRTPSTTTNTTATHSPLNSPHDHHASNHHDEWADKYSLCLGISPQVTSLPVETIINTTDAADLIRLWGCPVEVHNVHLPDGFILTLQRIPSSKPSSPSSPPPRPVLVWHGIGICSNVWVCSPDSWETNFALVLADAGFDVWLANSRGAHYTTEALAQQQQPVLRPGSSLSNSSSKTTTTSQPALLKSYGCTNHSPYREGKHRWDYSLDDVVHIDFPCVVNYILETTKADKVRYVGYSQGTATSFGALSVMDEMNDKVSIAVAMAPAMRPKLRSSVGRSIIDGLGGPLGLFTLFGSSEFLGATQTLKRMMPASLHGLVMDVALSRILDWDVSNLGSRERKAALYKHLVSGVSTKNVVHWFHLIQGDGSLSHYHVDPHQAPESILDVSRHTTHRRSVPVKYPTKHIRTPIHLFVGTHDPVSDLSVLKKHLPAQTKVTMVPSYSHMDFVWGVDAKERVWDDVVRVLQEH